VQGEGQAAAAGYVGSAVERFGHEKGEVGHRAADGGLDPAVDGLDTEDTPRLQASPDAAASIDATLGVLRHGEPRADDVNLPAEPAHGDEDSPAHVPAKGLREDETRARDVDPHVRGGGMVPELPSRLSTV
jgi:hypothetical protein